MLRSFGSDQGVPVVLGEKITAKVSGRFGPLPPRQFLDSFTRSNGLVWFYDGQAIQVSRADEMTTQLISLKSTTPDRLATVIANIGAAGERCIVKPSGETGLVYVAGPLKFVALVKGVAESLDAVQKERRGVDLTVQVFPLRYAWADDQTVLFREAQVLVPGVANMLRNLVGADQQNGSGYGYAGRAVRRLPVDQMGLRGTGLSAVGRAYAAGRDAARYNEVVLPPTNTVAPNVVQAADNRPTKAEELETPPPMIQADPRTNSVIVQDIPGRMASYEALIRSLDVPTGLVEIEAAIVDVNADRARSIGLPITAGWENNNVQRELRLSINPLETGNFAFTLLREGRAQFFTNLQALESCGQAKLISKPAVLTLDNIEAQLESTETFFVRIPGQFEVDLFDVTVGTMLRVTPHIIDDNGMRRVSLQVRVEDGTQRDQTVDQIPVIARNTINTQAVLAEQESLLIGGLTRDEKRRQVRGIPYLMNAPLVGPLFRRVDQSSQKIERYVLLTPRIIDTPHQPGCRTGEPTWNGGGALAPVQPTPILNAPPTMNVPTVVPNPPQPEPPARKPIPTPKPLAPPGTSSRVGKGSAEVKQVSGSDESGWKTTSKPSVPRKAATDDEWESRR